MSLGILCHFREIAPPATKRHVKKIPLAQKLLYSEEMTKDFFNDYCSKQPQRDFPQAIKVPSHHLTSLVTAFVS